ncbi:MAG: hypothetical protein HKO12_11445 [Woeseiaceae bacterium]|nr:hypothetical protein [Woeseiaceae bacterium]
MSKDFLISWVVVFVVWMAGSFVVHGVWLGETYAGMTDMMRPEEEQMGLFHFMLLAHVVMAGAFVWVYQRGHESKAWLPQGIRFGVAIALLAPIPMYTIYYTVQQMSGALAIQQIAGDTILLLVLGILVAFLQRDKASG